MASTTVRGYTTYGPVRDQSGILHRTREAADGNLRRDQRACRRHGGYSDRSVVIVGDDGYLYHDEDCASPVWPSHGQSNGAVRFYR